MSSVELTEWQAYARIYPLSADRMDLLFASLQRALAFGQIAEPPSDIESYLLFDHNPKTDEQKQQEHQQYLRERVKNLKARFDRQSL